VVTLLIERGANINATGDEGKTAVHYAAKWGIEDMMAFLLTKGAQANIRDGDGMTPIMLACFEGHLGVVKMLVQHMGVQGLNDRNAKGWTALHWASAGGHEKVARFLLLAGADPTITDNGGMAPITLATENYCCQGTREGRARRLPVFEVTPQTC
jgi:ankyrin repeat protein